MKPAGEPFGIPKITEILNEIVDNPKFPTSRIAGSYPDKSDEDVREIYLELAEKWRNVREGKRAKHNTKSSNPRGLSLDDFVKMTSDFYGHRVLNRDILNRVIHTGDRSVAVRAQKVNRQVLEVVSHFTELSLSTLEHLAEQALFSSRSSEDTKDIKQQDQDDASEPAPLQPPSVEETKPIAPTKLSASAVLESEQLQFPLPAFNTSIAKPFSRMVYEYAIKHGAEKLIHIIKQENPAFNDVDAKNMLLDILLGKNPQISVALNMAGILGLSHSQVIQLFAKV